MINEAIRLVRIFHDIPQNELAEKLGVSKSYLSELEAGKKPVSLALLEKYQSVFNIPVSSLMLFSENLDPDRKTDRIRVFAAKKVVRLLNWIAAKDVESGDSKEGHP